MNNKLIESFSPIQAIYLSESFCEMINSQSCDCDSIVIRSGDKFIILNYRTFNNEGYIERKPLLYFNANTYPYEVDLSDNVFKFDKISYSDEGFIEGIRFTATNVFLFILGSEHNLILTMSKYDLFEDIGMDFPETEAILKIRSHK